MNKMTIAKWSITGMFSVVAYFGLEIGTEASNAVSALSVCIAVFHWLFWPVNTGRIKDNPRNVLPKQRMKMKLDESAQAVIRGRRVGSGYPIKRQHETNQDGVDIYAAAELADTFAESLSSDYERSSSSYCNQQTNDSHSGSSSYSSYGSGSSGYSGGSSGYSSSDSGSSSSSESSGGGCSSSD